MNKEEFLQELLEKVNSGEITRDEVSRLLVGEDSEMTGVGVEKKSLKHAFSVTKLLYILGSIIVIIGVIIFVAQIWDDLGSFGRILITLGLGIVIAGAGSGLMKNKPKSNLGSVFHLIGGILIPGGIMVTLLEYELLDFSLWPGILMFGIAFLVYVILHVIQKQTVLTFFAIVHGTIFAYLLFGELISDVSYQYRDDYFAYFTMAVGANYLLLAKSFRGKWNEGIVRMLYFFGSAGILGAAFSQVFDSGVWQVLYFLIVFGGVLLSIYMKSRAILAVSTLFLIAHVSYITAEYFADSIGWPISLVILGFIFIGLGFGSVRINKEYISEK